MMKRLLTYTCVAGLALGYATASQAILFPIADALITPLPTLGTAQSITHTTKFSGDTFATIGSFLQDASKDILLDIKTSVGTDLPKEKLGDVSICTKSLNDSDDVTGELNKGVLHEPDVLLEQMEYKIPQDVKGDVAKMVYQVEKSRVDQNATLEGKVYAGKRLAYMDQETVVDTLAKVDVYQNMAEKLLGELDTGEDKPKDLNAAYRANITAHTVVNKLLSIYQEVLGARLQFESTQGLNAMGTLSQPVIKSDESKGE